MKKGGKGREQQQVAKKKKKFPILFLFQKSQNTSSFLLQDYVM